MRRILLLSKLAFLAAVAAVTTLPGQQPAPGPDGFVIRSGTNEVLLDVIVRDQRGKPLRGLKSEEIRVFEDDVEQEVVSFRMIDGAAGRVITSADESESGASVSELASPARGQDPLRVNHLVSIVFHGLQQDSRKFVLDAALEFLERNLRDNVFVGVFGIDNVVIPIQGYTNDHMALRAALKKASEQPFASFSSWLENAQQAGLTAVSFNTPVGDGSTATPAGAVQPLPGQQASQNVFGEIVQRIQAQTTVAMGLYDQVDRANRILNALTNLVEAQSLLAGRKTVLFFSPGFQPPLDSQWRLDRLVSDANEANVSFYAIDSAGLRTISPTSMQVAQMRGQLPGGLENRAGGGRGLQPTDFTQYETQVAGIRANPIETLNELAAETGGRLIANTNNFAKPLDRIVEDMLTYYEVSYRPPPPKLDGSFRELRVEVARPKAEVQTRSGYFDLPTDASYELSPYELPLLAALSTDPAPREMEIRGQFLKFPGAPGVVAAEFPLSEVMLRNSTGRSQGRFSALVQLKDSSGKIVRKASQSVPLDISPEDVEKIRRGSFLLERTWDVPPGRYSLETAVHDFESGKTGVRRASVVVPIWGAGPAVSSISLIRKLDPPPASAEAAASDPFASGAGVVRPTLDDRVDPALADNISHYFVIRPDPESDAPPELFLKYFRDGVLAAEGVPELPPAKADGTIPFIATAPAADFAPGHYLVEVAVRHNGRVALQRAAFEVTAP